MERGKVNKEYILFTADNFPEGGAAANYLNLFCEGVSERKRKITVYLFKGRSYRKLRTNDGRRSVTSYGVNYNYLGFANRPDGKLLKMVEDILSIIRTWSVMFRLISRRKSIVILVYSNRFPLNFPVYFISKLFRIQISSFVPEYLERHDLQKMSLFQKIKFRSFLLNYTYLNKLSDQLIVFSNFLKKDYVSIGYLEDKIIVQPNLTDLKKWYLPGQKINFTLGYAGMPSKKDGITDLIQAVKVLKDQGQPVTLIIVGDSFFEESPISFFENQCQILGIADQVTFTGLVPQDKVKEYLNSCEILAITRPDTKQTRAGFPTKLGEYMGCKKIVLATKFGDIQRYFTDKTDIVLAEPANPESIAAGISWILNNREKAKVIAAKGYESATEVLDFRAGVHKILDFLN